ncbi:hypothetical protein LCGC14_2429030, partial [marine sediment metagenome]
GVAGTQNLYLGYRAGRGLDTTNIGSRNVAIGSNSLIRNQTGYDCVALGADSMAYNESGYRNVGIGHRSLYKNNFRNNVAIGYYSSYNQVTGQGNVSIGYASGYGVANNSHSYNVSIGTISGYGVTTGSNNVNIGYASGRLGTTGSKRVMLGNYAGYNQTTISDLLIIDNQDRGSAAAEITDCLIYGVFNTTPASQSLRLNVGNLYLGNPTHSDADDGGLITQTFIREDGAGTATSAASWKIKKLIYSGTSVTSILWADGDTTFDNIWDNYSSLSYL